MLKHASLLISLILSSFYALGVSYHISYLFELGIEESQFQLSIDRIFFQGFLSMMGFSAKGILWFVLASLAIAGLTTVGLEMSKAFQKKPSLFSKLTNKINNKSKSEGFHALSETMVGVSVGGLTLFLLILTVLIASGNSGGAYAKKLKESYSSETIKKVKIKLKSNADEFYGNAVICSESQCAYWTEKGSIVLNKRDIESVTWLSGI